MNFSINTTLRGNISNLSSARLLEIIDELDNYESVLPREDLISIGRELLNHDKSPLNGPNLERMIYMLEANKPVKLREVQNVFLDYATRAKEGKQAGGQASGQARRKPKTRYLKRTTRKNNKSRRHK